METPAMVDGLAVYKTGEGEPIFLMPYPHASVTEPMAETELAKILVGMGRSVITFDPPGIFRSTREPLVTMEEMLSCTGEKDHRLPPPVVMNQELHELILNSKLEIFENSGHSPFIEEEEQFRGVLLAFLGEK
ncbi:MAG: hypothetical protein E4H36_13340 [Spirochaetales bacterium]|nr:MAG: hypothetical protein E4H36_13340 [Spirochaetales bacterium]